ncbi:MAG: hypothetical protein Q4G24_04765 [Paracoccus sp. (in: a-proteobacteria)]|uniref:hypothetical protein n=1 Tax=Paracoccus sp. TaxID=267 RepID=UPI0026DEA9E8|nr:hypothetical protein [Paracoccus sp. (in: a-proteobacteria)]MDO5620764.1 hypothetical protein [Paracoccus sp. (in: a-proteobacteria)]
MMYRNSKTPGKARVILALILGVSVLAGCNTVAGFGRDITGLAEMAGAGSSY